MAEFEAMLGRGVKARINGQTYYVGNEQLFADLGLNLEEVRIQVAALESEAQTVIMVGSSQGLMGLIVVADTLRPEAAAAMERLRQIGMEKLVMLTGDNPSAARAVTESLGLDLCFPGLMPGDKVGVVQGLLAEGNQVAMVGDGVNDAPALASATLGIAMGAAGSDAAIEAADIALMSDDLGKLPELIQLGRQARRTIKTNIILSLAIKAVFLGLGLPCWLSAMACGFIVPIWIEARPGRNLAPQLFRTSGRIVVPPSLPDPLRRDNFLPPRPRFHTSSELTVENI
jgi:Cd2+/Zn2+-exporting ATPase